MLTLEYRDKNKEKASSFITNLNNKLNLEKSNHKDIQIKLITNPSRKYNQYYYKIIIK
jgi:hypothetical protein